MSNPTEALDATRKLDESREIIWFDVPTNIAKSTGIVKVGLVELTSGEELLATERCRNNMARLGIENVKESLRFVNDRKVNSGDGSVDEFWSTRKAGMSYLRQLLFSAYAEIHNPKTEELKDFLSSRRTTV